MDGCPHARVVAREAIRKNPLRIDGIVMDGALFWYNDPILLL